MLVIWIMLFLCMLIYIYQSLIWVVLNYPSYQKIKDEYVMKKSIHKDLED